jgi:hypothetical protein
MPNNFQIANGREVLSLEELTLHVLMALVV